jgi:SM-20-related protein
MTPKQILDSFSDTLMQDERILSAQERSLVATLLRHAKTAAGQSPETQDAVRAAIAAAVGETVAQRAFSVLGESVVDRILKSRSSDSDAGSASDVHTGFSTSKPMRDTPAPPIPREPVPPVPKDPAPPGVRAPREPLRDTPVLPVPPASKEPAPPGRGLDTTVVSETVTAVAERPAVLAAKCCVLDEFLAPQELGELTQFAIDHESAFSASQVISPSAERGVIDYEYRRSRVLMDIEPYQEMILQRIKSVLPEVRRELDMEEFAVADMEAQITASNDGDFFRFHCDNGNDRVGARFLTFVYFFQREPRQFEGGELRLHDARLENGVYVSEGSYQTIVPQQNQIVFFPCELMHEVTQVSCASGEFANSRFTVNGWLRR